MEKKHTLSKKLPIVSMLLACGVAMVATVVVPDDKSVMSYLLSSAVAFAVLLVIWWWFSPEFNVDFKPRVSLKEVGILVEADSPDGDRGLRNFVLSGFLDIDEKKCVVVRPNKKSSDRDR